MSGGQALLGGVQPTGSSRIELSGLVLREIEATLGQLKGNKGLHHMVREPVLAQAGPTSSRFLRRSFMTLVICRALCGELEHALPAAAAVELFAAALDVFDDLEDQDAEDALWRKYGQAPAMNAATALLMLAQVAVARLRTTDVGESTVARAMEAVALAGATACSGQHHDLEYESRPHISEGQYFNMTRMKSASLVECACRLGAIAAGAEDGTVEALGFFGRDLGVAAQITNDVGSIGGQATGKSDISRRKKTLPVVYALSHAEEADRAWLGTVYGSSVPIDAQTEQQVLEVLRRSGAIHYSLVRADLYRRRAARSLKRANILDSARREICLALCA